MVLMPFTTGGCSMKKIAIIVSFILVLTATGFSKEKSFTGRVIYIANDHIEVKYGKTEKIFFINEKSEFTKNKSNASFSSLEVCQVVRITYTLSDNKMYIKTCEILKDSDCK